MFLTNSAWVREDCCLPLCLLFLYTSVDVDMGDVSWLSFFESQRAVVTLFSFALCRLALRLFLFTQSDCTDSKERCGGTNEQKHARATCSPLSLSFLDHLWRESKQNDLRLRLNEMRAP